jgi:hypothetical protein
MACSVCRISSLDLAAIGNFNYGALVDGRGRVLWCSLPHSDRDPIFCPLLGGEEGAF